MLEPLQQRIRRLLKVPPEPDPPLGDPASLRIFRAAPGFVRYRLVVWGWKQLSALAGLVAGIAFVQAGMSAAQDGPGPLRWVPWSWIDTLETFAVAGFVLQVVYSLILVLLDYRYRWYMITDRSLRIREGLWTVRERTMTFSNVQNVAVNQGPLQRLFGIADLKVQTAGGGGKTESGGEPGEGEQMHVGYFRGVDNAAEIRDAVLARLRRWRGSGLGEPDEPVSPEARPQIDTAQIESPQTERPQTGTPRSGAGPGALEAAREVLAEARSLTRALRG